MQVPTRRSETANEMTIKLVLVRRRCFEIIKYITVPLPKIVRTPTITSPTLNQSGNTGAAEGAGPISVVVALVVVLVMLLSSLLIILIVVTSGVNIVVLLVKLVMFAPDVVAVILTLVTLFILKFSSINSSVKSSVK
jgi:hypothetical protein